MHHLSVWLHQCLEDGEYGRRIMNLDNSLLIPYA